MPRCTRLPMIGACLLGSLWILNNSRAAATEAAFTPIFNGNDLTAWEGEPGYWSVEDGALTGTTTAEKPLRHATYLFWRGGAPGDFELRAEYRFQSPTGNSGINFRSTKLPKGDVKGYQADMEIGPVFTGVIYECNQRGLMTRRGQRVVIAENGKKTVTAIPNAPDYQRIIKPNDWNEYVILARGPEITLSINGAVTCQLVDHEKGKAALSGLISLQLHPGPPMKVQFKNMRIKNLDSSKR